LSGLVIKDPHGPTYRGLAALQRAYPNYVFNPRMPVVFIPNSILISASNAAQRLTELSVIGFQAIPVQAVLAGDSETAAQVLKVRRTAKASPERTQGKAAGVISFDPMVFHKVSKGESLSKIALRHYGNMHKWPIIFEANRKSPENPNGLGNNPNLIYPNQVLWIPDLPKVGVSQN
jgi:nucleoid-associated protein YgaU